MEGGSYMWFLISGIIFVALLCIISLLPMSLLKCGDQNCTACSRCEPTRDLYNGRISSLLLYLKLRAMNPRTLLAVLQPFSVYLCHLRSGDDDSLIPLLTCCWQMLIGHVIVALDVVVSDVHQRTFIYIETHLPLICPLIKFIAIFL